MCVCENGLYMLSTHQCSEYITQSVSHKCGGDLQEEYHFHFTDEKNEVFGGAQLPPAGSGSSLVLLGYSKSGPPDSCQVVS